MAPLTGIAFATNLLTNKLNINIGVVKTTSMITIFFWLFLPEFKSGIMACTPSMLYLSHTHMKSKEGAEGI